MYLRLNHHIVVSVVLAILAASALIECDRQAAGRRIQPATSGFRSPCGTAEEVSMRVGKCLEPIFDIVEGRFNVVKDDNDIVFHCQKFNSTERCIRTISKDCLTGVHRTAVSAVASAIKRFRSSECKNEQTRSRYIEPLRCARTTGKPMASLYRNYTAMLQVARDMPIAPEQKLLRVCCSLLVIDKDIESVFNAACPVSTPLVLGIVHAITDDARSTMCINPKCQGVMESIRASQLKSNQNFIEPVAQILFQLTDS